MTIKINIFLKNKQNIICRRPTWSAPRLATENNFKTASGIKFQPLLKLSWFPYKQTTATTRGAELSPSQQTSPPPGAWDTLNLCSRLCSRFYRNSLVSTPARAFLFIKKRSRRNKSRFFFSSCRMSEHAAVAEESRAAAVTCLTCPSFFSPRRPLRLSTPSVLFLPRAAPLSLSLSLHLELDGGASDVFQSLLSLQYGVCACAESCTDIYTTPPRTRPGQREQLPKRNTQEKKPKLFHPVESVQVAFPLLFLVSFGNFSFLGSWFLMAESPRTPQVLVPGCPVRGEAPRWLRGGQVYWTGGPNVTAEISPGNIIFKLLFPVLFWPLTPVLLVPRSEWCHRTADQCVWALTAN